MVDDVANTGAYPERTMIYTSPPSLCALVKILRNHAKSHDPHPGVCVDAPNTLRSLAFPLAAARALP